MLKKIISSKEFSVFILIVVLLNSIVLRLQTSQVVVQELGDILSFIDSVCLYIFVIEAFVKILILKTSYFKSGWNWFDFLIVISSLLSSIPALSSARALRVVRVFRSFKFISGIKNLQIIVTAIGKSLPRIGWTAILMILIFYVFSIIGTVLFGEMFPNWFGSIGKTIFSLFQIMTLESWSMGIARPVMAAYPYAFLYFVPFVILSSFVILNIVVGIVVNSINDVTNEKEKSESLTCQLAEIKKHLEQIERTFFETSRTNQKRSDYICQNSKETVIVFSHVMDAVQTEELGGKTNSQVDGHQQAVFGVTNIVHDVPLK